MEKKHAQKWIVSFIAAVLAVLLLLSCAAWAVDPFFQFRVRDNAYMLSGYFVSGGLIKNYDYDTLIIGSSVTQNFDMDVFRGRLGVRPLHIGLGGITPAEIESLMALAYDVRKADTFYIGADLPVFAGNTGENHLPRYLMKDGLLSKLRYLLSYEVWFRYIPVDLGLLLLTRLGLSLPPKFAHRTSIDMLEDWRLGYSFGKEITLDNYKNERYGVSEVDPDGLDERMLREMDRYLEQLDFSKGEHVFFFPPYSSLFWCDAQERGTFEPYLSAKRHFIEKALQAGAAVYDFQAAELTLDLENYKDTTHYSPAINDWMVACFASGDYAVTSENAAAFEEKLIENTKAFRLAYADLFAR